MKVTTAKTAGFCFGVRRAVETVYEQVEHSSEPVYTFGPIIHNEQVVQDLESRGVKVIHSEEELRGITQGTVVIRSHGVPRSVCQTAQEQGLKVVDATCPFVKKIHRIVEEESRMGHQIVIIGNPSHPEVEGIKGWCHSPAIVISTEEEARKFTPDPGSTLCIVSQTTFNYNKFQDLVEILAKKRYDKRNVLNTICSATQERQQEAARLAAQVDAMIVIGGKNSSNTQKLYEICKKECTNTYYIQTLVDLETKPFQSISHVGITAGASTPNNIIEEVQKHVRIKF